MCDRSIYLRPKVPLELIEPIDEADEQELNRVFEVSVKHVHKGWFGHTVRYHQAAGFNEAQSVLKGQKSINTLPQLEADEWYDKVPFIVLMIAVGFCIVATLFTYLFQQPS